MSSDVHYLGAYVDSARFSKPIVTGDLEADKIVIIHSQYLPIWGEEHEEIGWYPAPKRLKAEFDSFDIPTETIYFELDDFWESNFNDLTETVFNHMRDELNKGNNVYLNVSSEPPHLNYAMIYASLILTHEFDRKYQHNMSYYITRGSPWYFSIVDDLIRLSRDLSSIRNAVDSQQRVMDDISNVISNLEKENRDLYDFKDEISISPNPSISYDEEELQMVVDDLSYFNKKYREFQDSIEQLQNNDILRNLSQDELVNLLDNEFARIIHSFSSNSVDQNAIPPILIATHGEVDQLSDAVNEMNIRISDIERATPRWVLHNAPLDRLKEEGSTEAGIYHKFPIPPNNPPKGVEIAILYTLYRKGHAESITSLLNELVRISLRIMKSYEEHGVDTIDDERVEEIRRNISDSIRSNVQYNINHLESKGYVKKKKTGRTSEIHPTDNVDIWFMSRGIEDAEIPSETIIDSFDKIIERISEEVESN